MGADQFRSRITYSLLCSVPYRTICRYRIRRRDMQSMGHGDRAAEGKSTRKSHRCARPNGQWTLSGHKGWVLCVEWDSREKILATGGHDGQVRLWDPKTGQPLGNPLLGHTKWITALSFEPLHLVSAKSQTPRLATSSKDSTVRIWNTSTRKLEFVLTGHAASVNAVKWGGENVIYTASSDRTVKVWSGVDVSRPVIARERC